MPPGGKVQGKAPAPPPQSDLAAQLQQLAVTQGVNQGRRHPGKASLLYTFQEAADIEADAIHRIGVEGKSGAGPACLPLPLPPPPLLARPPAAPHPPTLALS